MDESNRIDDHQLTLYKKALSDLEELRFPFAKVAGVNRLGKGDSYAAYDSLPKPLRIMIHDERQNRSNSMGVRVFIQHLPREGKCFFPFSESVVGDWIPLNEMGLWPPQGALLNLIEEKAGPFKRTPRNFFLSSRNAGFALLIAGSLNLATLWLGVELLFLSWPGYHIGAMALGLLLLTKYFILEPLAHYMRRSKFLSVAWEAGLMCSGSEQSEGASVTHLPVGRGA